MTAKSMQREGFPNISIRLYEDYDAWLEHRFVELAATFTTMTMRDSLYGRNEGLLQFYDTKNLHTKMNGEQIIQVSVKNANSDRTQSRIYGSKHFAVSVDSKGDNIITIQLAPIHEIEDLKFSRMFYPSVQETLVEMTGVIYQDRPLLSPPINGINVYAPNVPWCDSMSRYMEFIREVGLAVETDKFVFVWEDIDGISIQDYEWLTSQEPINFVVGEPRLIGQFIQNLETPLAFDFEWLTKANQHTRKPYENATVYAHSFLDKNATRITFGEGQNSILVSRSGGYADYTYRNGFEEAQRLITMSQYDGYAHCKTYGNFELTPGDKINFFDPKNQFKYDFYVDEVIHEVSNNTSITNLYMFTNGKPIEVEEPPKVKNELKTDSTDEENTAG